LRQLSDQGRPQRARELGLTGIRLVDKAHPKRASIGSEISAKNHVGVAPVRVVSGLLEHSEVSPVVGKTTVRKGRDIVCLELKGHGDPIKRPQSNLNLVRCNLATGGRIRCSYEDLLPKTSTACHRDGAECDCD